MWDHLSHARVVKLEKLVSMHNASSNDSSQQSAQFGHESKALYAKELYLTIYIYIYIYIYYLFTSKTNYDSFLTNQTALVSQLPYDVIHANVNQRWQRKQTLTSLTANSIVSRLTVTNISINPINARPSVQTGITGTFVDICNKRQQTLGWP